MDFLVTAAIVNGELFGLFFLLCLVLCLWFLEKLSSVSIFLSDSRNLFFCFLGLGIVCTCSGWLNFFEVFYTPELGLINDVWARLGRITIGLILFISVFLVRARGPWVNIQGSSTTGDLFLIISLFVACSVLVSTVNLLLFVIFFETMSLILYVLSLRTGSRGLLLGEGVLKYVISSGLSSSIVYLGFYMLSSSGIVNGNFYPWSEGSLLLQGLTENTGSGSFLLSLVGSGCIIFGILFKFGLVPFHFWIPDLYQGLSLQGLGIFMLVPKLTLFFVLMRFSSWLNFISDVHMLGYQNVLLLFGSLSVVFGAVMMLNQSNLARLLGFSGVHNFGYIFIALGLNNLDSLAVSGSFIFFYMLTIIGLLIVLRLFMLPVASGEQVYDLDFLVESMKSSNRGLTWIFFLYFFILLGLPPSYGFYLKAQVVSLLCRTEMAYVNGVFVAVILVVFTFLSVVVYLRLLSKLFMAPSFSSTLAENQSDIKMSNLLYVTAVSIAILLAGGWCLCGFDFFINLFYYLILF